MAVNFEDVDKVESAANFCILEVRSIFLRTSILSPGSKFLSIIFGSLTLIWKFDPDFGENK